MIGNDYNASFPLGFLFSMAQYLSRIWRMRCGAICALVLICACIAASAYPQDATSETSAGKATPKPSSASKPAPSSTGAAKSTGATHSASAKRSSRKKKPARARGQQKIDPERARTIQEALIREHYLSGDASGTWNQASEDAMRRYQSDHGWQTKEVPDSRALIQLGLGPSKDHLLNPESAMTTGPDAPRSTSPQPASQTATPASPAPAQSPTQSDPPSPQ
jgi:hypothetical protein